MVNDYLWLVHATVGIRHRESPGAKGRRAGREAGWDWQSDGATGVKVRPWQPRGLSISPALVPGLRDDGLRTGDAQPLTRKSDPICLARALIRPLISGQKAVEKPGFQGLFDPRVTQKCATCRIGGSAGVCSVLVGCGALLAPGPSDPE
jgi:hypothetical protein